VINGVERPKVTAYDGMQNLKIVEAIYEASASGKIVLVD